MTSKSKSLVEMAIDNNPCKLCRAMKSPICPGHSPQAGGGEGGGGGGGEAKKEAALNPAPRASSQVATAANHAFTQAKTNWIASHLFNDRTLNYEAGLFVIEGDRIRGNFTFQIKPDLSKEEMKLAQQFLKAIKAEFDDFKEQLIERGVPVKHKSAVLKDTELTIHLPNPKYYNEFMKRLENRNLLPTPTPNPKQQNKKEMADELPLKERTSFSPFGDILKGPKPKGVK